MSTPKSKKPSPLITANSPKVAVWYQCKNCSIYLNQKDSGLHSCEELMKVKHSFILNNDLYSFIEVTDGIDNQNLNLDSLVLMSLSAIQLCKFQIGEAVQLTDLKHNRHVAKIVWPTSSRSLLSVQLSNHVLHDLKINSGDPIRVSSLSQVPKPISEIFLHCAVDIDQYDPQALVTAVGSQLRCSLVHLNQTVIIVFYGMELMFSVQKLVPCEEATLRPTGVISTNVSDNKSTDLMSQVTNRTHSKSQNTRVDSLDQHFQMLSIDGSQQKEDPIVFYKVIESTKFTISNHKARCNGTSDTVLYKMEDLGGLTEVVESIVNILNISLGLSPSLEGMKKCNGILIYGVNGTGKTSLIHSLASHMKVHTVVIQVADMFSKFYGEAEFRLKAAFDAALDHAPSLLLLDNLDVLCTVTQVDRLHELQACVVLLAVTTSLDNVDVSLRTPGRLDQEIELPVPSRDQRAAILHCLLTKVPHSLSTDQIQQVAFITHGFVGGDLATLLSNATSALLVETEGTGQVLSYDGVMRALDHVKPSAMRQVLVEVPNVKWSDIGGQDEVKLKLRQSVEWPLKHPEAFARLGIKPPRGILMFGPPGCSKTMIAKALATESKLNFISVKGPELFRKYVGESERCVRDVFKRARQVSPSVIFFDELDSLAGERGDGGGGGGSNVQERVLAQMLTEMDGIVPLNNVTIVAATNRPDRIDKALLRPGRLDRLIYVPLPDDLTRAAILKIRLARSPLGEDVCVEELIVAVCDEAALSALENNLEAAYVSHQDFLTALQLVKPRTPPQLIKLYENYIKK
ncbi:hypothetical protein M8J76_000292 [Diaphorina citri]|nr:hypothetical protein M8J76_000292 [Diaphorina citri]